jgi:hypothetical protein
MTSRLALDLALAKLDSRGLQLVCDRYIALAAIAVDTRCAGRRIARSFVMLSANSSACAL